MTEVKGRPVVVDWVVPKDQYEQSVVREERIDDDKMEGETIEAERTETSDGSERERDESDAMSHDDDDSVESLNGDDDDDVISHDSAAESCDSEDESHDSDAQSTDHKELKQLFYEFGRVRYCRVVLNPETELCTGMRCV